MNSDDNGKAFLQLCVSKRLIEPKQAAELWLNAQRTAERPQRLIERMGLLASHTITSLESELRDTQEPRTIAGFRTIELLGRGGMASVYLAEQRSLGRQVALKIMAPHVAADAVGTERFLREARIAATVNHRNVIGIIDVGYADGCLYMALELVTGGDAAQLAERFGGAVPEARALELILDCANGLQALFEARLVHRDIKPSNIFIGADGVAKLGDLGLARTEDGADRLTHTGLLIGTPAFMSPEQAGSGDAIDIRSDIYSLGATLFTLVTGRQPFTGSNPIAIAAKALTEPVPDPRALAPSLSPTTAKLIQRTMQKSPAQRFQTPHELIDAIRQALTTAATHSPGDSAPLMNRSPTATTVGTSKPRRALPRRGPRNNHGNLVIGIALVALIGGMALTWLLTTSHTKTPEQTRETAVIVPPAATPTPTPKAAPPKPTPTPVAVPPVVSATPTPTPPPVTAPSPVVVTTPTPMAVPTPPEPEHTQVLATESARPSPPVGADPVTAPWASGQGKDAFGHWLTLTVGKATQRFRWLPPGTCTIGSPQHEAGHLDTEQLSIVTFTYGAWFGETECTQALWEAVQGSNPATARGAQLPATDFTVTEAIDFTHALRRHVGGWRARLPSRAEWERACRAGTTTAFYTGNDITSLKGHANLAPYVHHADGQPLKPLGFDDGFPKIAPVASFLPNRWGYYDLHGNVGEYCLAIWKALPPTCRDPLTDDNPAEQVGFLRGGTYESDEAFKTRCASLPFIGPTTRKGDIGLRVLIEQPH